MGPIFEILDLGFTFRIWDLRLILKIWDLGLGFWIRFEIKDLETLGLGFIHTKSGIWGPRLPTPWYNTPSSPI